jgi:hypothetical protein
MSETREQTKARLETLQVIAPNCAGCEDVYRALENRPGAFPLDLLNGPRHKPSDKCESGKHPHCTCDVCW